MSCHIGKWRFDFLSRFPPWKIWILKSLELELKGKKWFGALSLDTKSIIHVVKCSKVYPVQNVTWIPVEIPCHFMSQIDLVAVWSKLTASSMTIPCHLSRFYLFSMLKHDIDFGGVQVMEFPWPLLRKWWDFHRIWFHFQTRPNCRQKDIAIKNNILM